MRTCPAISQLLRQFLFDLMIEEDMRFFRENFSASSMGDSQPEDTPHATYETKSRKHQKASANRENKTPSQKEPSRRDHSEHPREEGRLGHSWVDASKHVQMKILERLRTEHNDIKQMQKSEEQPKPKSRKDSQQRSKNQDMKDSRYDSRAGREREFSQVQRQQKQDPKNRSFGNDFPEEKGGDLFPLERSEEFYNDQRNDQHYSTWQEQRANSAVKEETRSLKHKSQPLGHRQRQQHPQHELKKSRQEVQDVRHSNVEEEYDQFRDLKHRQGTDPGPHPEDQKLHRKITQLEQHLLHKDGLITRLRNNDSNLEEKYKDEIKSFQQEVERMTEENASLMEQLIERDVLIQEFQSTTNSNDQIFRLEHDLEIARNNERDYQARLSTFESQSNLGGVVARQQETTTDTAGVTNELSRLKQALSERDEEWLKRLSLAVEDERKANIAQFQRLLANQTGFIRIEEGQQGSNADQVNVESALNQLVSEIQTFKQSGMQEPPAAILDEMKLIREILTTQQHTQGLEHHPSQQHLSWDNNADYYHIDSTHNDPNNQNPSSQDYQLLKSELQSYKQFIIEEEKMKRSFLEELELYKDQNEEIIQENKFLRQQIGSLQDTYAAPAPGHPYDIQENYALENEDENVGRLKQTIQEHELRLLEKSKYIEDLETELMNTQPKPIVLQHSGETITPSHESYELYQEIDRIKGLLESEIAQLTRVGEEKARSYQQQYNMYEERIQLLEGTIDSAQRQLGDYEARVAQLSSHPTVDQTQLTRTIDQLRNQNNHFRTQISSLVQTNRQLQQQIKERTHAVEHLWQVKQAQYQNVAQLLNRIKAPGL